MIKKVIHIVLGKANPNKANGVNKVVCELANAQTKKYNVELWGITKNLVHNYPQRDFKTRLFRQTRMRFKLDPELVLSIKNIDSRFTMVHIHGGFIPENYSATKLLRKKGVQYIFTCHGAYNSVALKKSKWGKSIFTRFFDRAIIKSSKGVQALGENEKKSISRIDASANILMIPNGQSKKDLSSDDSRSDRLELCFLGRIDIHTKGLDMLMEAMNLVDKNKVHLTIIGAGGEMESLKDLIAKNKLSDKVTLSGALYGEMKDEALRNSDALVLLSRNEGMPGVVLEAAAVGTPSIVSPGTNFIPYIEKYDAGYPIKSFDSEDIAQIFLKVRTAKRSGELKRKSQNSYHMVDDCFSWDRIVEEFSKAYAA
ncbi:MAG: glycosyltransferase family 4 protein [Crocinitomicaceae bacterium]|nr:glycosyltransferase family 4 protein [Crocinitomicaceae bacterium]